MDEDPVYLKTVSLHLARVLDEIGLNQLTVKKRRRTFSFMEHLQTTLGSLTDTDISVYYFGSQTEGATTIGLRSDLDELTCFHEYNAMQDWSEWHLGKLNLLMLHEDTASGYCRLQLLRSDIPKAVEDLSENGSLIFDSSGRVIMTNTFLNNNCMGNVRNGPAQTRIGEHGMMDGDYVLAIKCKSWPRTAEEFIRRHRRHSWPTHGLLQQVVHQGCFLVPVGHKLSPTEPLEWRISASLAERCLMFSLNNVHLKVYVLLKLLVRSFIEPRASKCISSYHCKTALLYCTENTDSGVWVERKILHCVTLCLELLNSWVTEGFCPHFIFPDLNLFAGKVTVQNRGTLLLLFRDLIISNGRVLLGVRIDDIGLRLQAHLSQEPSVVPIHDSPVTVILIGNFEYETHSSITNSILTIFLTHAHITEPINAIRSVYTNIEILKGRIRKSDKLKRQAANVIIECLYGWLGSLLASVSLSRKMRVPRVAKQLLSTRATTDVAAVLKIASVFYSNGDYRKVETVLHSVDNHYCSHMIQSICTCYDKPMRTPPKFLHMMYATKGRKKRAKLCAYCVVFSRQEIHCVPPALRNEFFKSVGDDFQHRGPEQDEKELAVVDCLPYLYFLQYMTYRQLGHKLLQKQSLLSLKRCIRDNNDFSHLETAWNLLGQCMELEEISEAAMSCYMTSLQIRAIYNAANWHFAILCYKVIKPHI